MKSSTIKNDKVFQEEQDFPSQERTQVYEYVIVGGGIAGVCIAEMLSRSGKSVLLIEKETKIATESSGEQHCWGQFGYLYLNLPDPGVAEACIQNVNFLLNKYPLPGNNLQIQNNELVSNYPSQPLAWYRDEHVYYYYGLPNDPRFALNKQEMESWTHRLENVVVRTKALSEYTWPVTHEGNRDERKARDDEDKTNINENKHDIVHGSVFPKVTDSKEAEHLLSAKFAGRQWMHAVAKKKPQGHIAKRLKEEKKDIHLNTEFVVESHDRPMRSKRILQSVYNRFRMQKGSTLFETEITEYQPLEDGTVEVTSKDGKKILAKKVIFTAGSGLHKIDGTNVKTVKSPLLIVPKVCDKHLVYLTPKQQFTINHLHHEDYKSEKAYSIIGNGDGVNPDDAKALEESRKNIIRQAEEVFPNLRTIPESEKHVYFGLKTEFMQNNQRNYHYALMPLSKDEQSVWAAVPGKFTLAPSLAIHVYQTFEGGEPPVVPYTYEEESAYVKAAHLHITLAGDIVNDNPLEKVNPDALEVKGLQLARTDSGSSVGSNIGDTLHGQIIGGKLGADGRTLSQRDARNVLERKTKTLHVDPNKSSKTGNESSIENSLSRSKEDFSNDSSMYSPKPRAHVVRGGLYKARQDSGKDEEFGSNDLVPTGKITRSQALPDIGVVLGNIHPSHGFLSTTSNETENNNQTTALDETKKDKKNKTKKRLSNLFKSGNEKPRKDDPDDTSEKQKLLR